VRLPTPPITLAIVATALVVSVAVSSGETSSPAADATTVAGTAQQISIAELVCPVARSTKNVAQSTLAAAAPSTTASGKPSSGTISVYPLTAVPTASAPLAEAPIGSSVVRYPVRAVKGGPLVVRATGDYARGLTAAVTTRTPSGPGRSLQTEQCCDLVNLSYPCMHEPQNELVEEGKWLALLSEHIDTEHRDWHGGVHDAHKLEPRTVVAEPPPDHVG